MSTPTDIVIVELTWYEIRCAALVGLERRVRAMERGHQDCNLQTDSNRWTDHIEGACAEMAVAKYLGRYWSASIDTYRTGGDVGAYQVRSSPTIAELKIHDRDKDQDIFIKVYGRVPNFRLFGWIMASNGKEPRWYHDRGNGGPNAFWVPPEYLNPMRDLPNLDCVSNGKRKGWDDGPSPVAT